jgi:hypothetical protein
VTYPLPDDPWDRPDFSAHPPQPHNPQPPTIHIGRPPGRRGSAKTALAIVGVVVAVCCGLGAIGIIGSAFTGDPKPDTVPNAAAPTTPDVIATTEEPAAYVAPTSAAPPPASPTKARSSPTPRRTTSSPKPKCDPNYADACVPIASDVDCGGGSGNGPAYFYGTARVVGSDIYDLDRDNDGIACEKD